ncbi:hypothetical protein [Methylobacterium sp. B1]|uniref:hypothetical protein n=1 Tax=Methylobacterium sp. B1 TaxID=91459 RepID=UPI0011D20DBD|nr:hypothetical protein [Methylobacterium sp. B1]
MDTSFQFIIGIATTFAVLSPGVFIAIREAVKRQRQEIITDLAAVFDTDKDNNLHLIPSFEFVKYKYFVGSRRSSDPDPTGIESARRAAGILDLRRKREDFSTISWIIGCSAFSALAGSAVFYISSFVMYIFSTQMSNPSGLVWTGASYPIRTSFGIVWLFGVCAAFAGSYLMSLRNFHRAIKNFD